MMMMIGFQLITRKYSVAVATRIYILRGIWNIGGWYYPISFGLSRTKLSGRFIC